MICVPNERRELPGTRRKVLIRRREAQNDVQLGANSIQEELVKIVRRVEETGYLLLGLASEQSTQH